MKWWHWLLTGIAIAILAVEKIIGTSPNLSGQFIYLLVLEVVYFIVLLLLGLGLGRVMQHRLLAREDSSEFKKSVGKYRLMAFVFTTASILFMFFPWIIPGWIGRNIIFIGGYYFGLSRKHRVK